MTDALRIGKRAFTVAVVAATIIWAAGFAALVAPNTAKAVDLEAGDLIKGPTLSTVYYYAADGERYVFPNSKTYFTWYEDFSGVTEITDAELADISIGSDNVVYRPGTRLVKITTDPKTYAVTPNGSLRWIETEEVAEGLWGSTWNQWIDDVPDDYFGDYTIGTSLMDVTFPEGALVSPSDSDDVYYIDSTGKRLVSDLSDNSFQDMYVLETSLDLSGYTDGDALDAEEWTLVDTGQTGVAPTESTGDITASLATDNPLGVTLPADAQTVDILNVTLSGEGTVTGMVYQLSGIADSDAMAACYLYEGDTRLTDGRSVNSSTKEVTFSNLGLDLSSRDIDLRCDIASAATLGGSGTFAFQLESLETTATVSGLPVTGNTFSYSDAASVGDVDMNATGSIANPTIGQADAKIGRFSLQTSGEDGSFEHVTLTVEDANDHDGFELYQDETLLAECTDIGNDLVECVLDTPYALADGHTKHFDLYADVGGDAGNEIHVFLDEVTDLRVVGTEYGFSLDVDNADYDEGGTNCAAATDDCSFSDIEGGQLTIAFNGPSAGEWEIDSQEQTCLDLTWTAEQNVTIKEMNVTMLADDDGDDDPTDEADDSGADDDGLLNNTDSENNVKDIKFINADTLTTVMGPVELTGTDDADEDITFTEDWNLDAGESINLLLVVDVDNSVTAGTEFACTLDVSTIDVDDNNGDTLSDIVPTADITSYNQTTQDATLDINYTVPPSGDENDAFIMGQDDIDSVGFAFTAGAASGITVTDLTFTMYADDDIDVDADDFTANAHGSLDVNNFIDSCSLYDAATDDLVDGPRGIETNGDLIFQNFDWYLEAGETRKALVQCDTAKVSLTSSTSDAYAIDIDATTDVTAFDDGDDDIADNITVTTENVNSGEPSTLIRLVTSGDVTLGLDSANPNAEIVVANSSDNLFTVVEFEATDEAFVVEEFTVVEHNADAETGTIGTWDASLGDITATYENSDGDSESLTGFLTAGYAQFTGADVYVAANDEAKVYLYADIPAIADGATTGHKPALAMHAHTGDYGSANFKAVGQSSGVTLEEGDMAATDEAEGNAHYIRETAPTITKAAGSGSGSSVPGILEVLEFTVAANSGEDVIWNEILFDFVATDNDSSNWNQCTTGGAAMATSDWTLYDSTNTAVEAADANWSLLDSSLTSCGNGEDLEYFMLTLAAGNEQTVSAGSSETYTLEFDASGADAATDDAIRVDIPEDPVLAVGSFIANTTLNEADTTKIDTTLTVTATAAWSAGDILCLDEGQDDCDSDDELVLVTSVTNATTVVVYRGYLGTAATTPADMDAGDHIDYIHSTFVWDDDGSDGTINEIGSYLLDSLPVRGGTFVF